jgi:hypothetical protein
MKVVIIGGGIGGLCTALSLKKNSFEVVVYESVKQIKPLGVGINTLPHSVRILEKLGLMPTLTKEAVETSDLIYFNKYGQKFWSEPRGKFAGYKWPQFSIHRGRLQMLLVDQVKSELGTSNLLTGLTFSHFIQTGNKVVSYFKNEDGTIIHSDESDLLIGADGINSKVRKQLFPNEGSPVYSQNVLYRGTTFMKPFLNGRSMVMIGSMKQKMVVYPIENRANENGDYLEFICELKVQLDPPLVVGETSHGVRRIIPIIGGTFIGPNIKGEILKGGADWQIVRKDGVAELEAHYQIKTDDGTIIYIKNKGLRVASPEIAAKIGKGELVPPTEYYRRTHLTFEAPKGKYECMNNAIFISSGSRNPDNVVIKVWKIN